MNKNISSNEKKNSTNESLNKKKIVKFQIKY